MEAYHSDYGGDMVAHLLKEPTAGKIKEAAEKKIKGNHIKPADIDIIKDFLRSGRKEKTIVAKKSELLNAISSYKYYDRLKKFISQYKITNPADTNVANVDFLAWLIDFEPRPMVPIDYHNFQTRKIDNLRADLETLIKTEKELFLLDQLVFTEDFLNNLKERLLIEILKNYNLENNVSFCRYRDKINDDLVMQTFTIRQLETKVISLKRKLRTAARAKRWAGGLGLFFVAIDYKVPSMDNMFEDLLEEYLGVSDIEEFFEDII